MNIASQMVLVEGVQKILAWADRGWDGVDTLKADLADTAVRELSACFKEDPNITADTLKVEIDRIIGKCLEGKEPYQVGSCIMWGDIRNGLQKMVDRILGTGEGKE